MGRREIEDRDDMHKREVEESFGEAKDRGGGKKTRERVNSSRGF